MKIRIEKRYVSLIEVLIAIVLTIAIMTTLTFFYSQVTEIGAEVDRVNIKNFNMRYIEARLADILPKAVGEKNKEKDFVFFSIGDEGLTKPGSQSLIFTFDNEVSLAKVFSGHVLARIYLDKNGNLMIAYWPSPKRWEKNQEPPMKKEMLFQGAENLAFEFYIAPAVKETKTVEPDNKAAVSKDEGKQNAKPAKEKEATEPEPKGEWRRQAWLEDYKQLPVMIKIIVTMPKGQESLVFIYPLANAKTHVIYE